MTPSTLYPPPTNAPPPSPPTHPSNRRSRATRLLLPFNLLLLTLALYLIPTLTQHLVEALSALSSLTGRRARTPYEDIPTASVVLGVVVLAVWHGVLGGMSWYSMRRGWSRVLVVGWLGGGFLVGVGKMLGG